jgi:hypothetical protein
MSTPATPGLKTGSHGIEHQLDAAINGLQTAVPSGITNITLSGVSLTIAALITEAQTVEKPWTDVRAAHAVIRAAMATRPGDIQMARGFLANLKAGLVSVLGADSQELLKFGLTPRSPRKPLTSAQKVVRAAKAKLTREARHTMGSRQKAGLRNTETPVVTIGPDGTLIAPPASSVPVTPVATVTPVTVSPVTPAKSSP